MTKKEKIDRFLQYMNCHQLEELAEVCIEELINLGVVNYNEKNIEDEVEEHFSWSSSGENLLQFDVNTYEYK